jgi:hypothetical protein
VDHENNPPTLTTSTQKSMSRRHNLLLLGVFIVDLGVGHPTSCGQEGGGRDIDSSTFEWTSSELEDYSHDPHMMRVTQVEHIELFISLNYYSCVLLI